MGQLSSSLRRQTRAEILEQLETRIRKKEEHRLHNDQTKAVVIRTVNLSAMCLFVLISFLFLLTVVDPWVVGAVPIVYFFTRLSISYHFKEKLKNSYYELYKMKEEKKMLLEEVKSNENYMEAKKLLDQYGEDWRSPRSTQNDPGDSSRKPDDDVAVSIE